MRSMSKIESDWRTIGGGRERKAKLFSKPKAYPALIIRISTWRHNKVGWLRDACECRTDPVSVKFATGDHDSKRDILGSCRKTHSQPSEISAAIKAHSHRVCYSARLGLPLASKRQLTSRTHANLSTCTYVCFRPLLRERYLWVSFSCAQELRESTCPCVVAVSSVDRLSPAVEVRFHVHRSYAGQPLRSG